MKSIRVGLAICIAAAVLLFGLAAGAGFLGGWRMGSYPAPIGPIALTVNSNGDQIVIVGICNSRLLRGVRVREIVEGGTEPIGTWRLVDAVDQGRVELNLAHPSSEWEADGPQRLDKPDTRYVIVGWGDDDRITDSISAETRLLQSLDPSKAIIGYEEIGPVNTATGAKACAGRA